MVIFIILNSVSAYTAPPVLFFKKTVKTFDKEKYISYKVKKGDYLYGILKKLNIPYKYYPNLIQEIKKINFEIKDINKLYVGQILNIPIESSYANTEQKIKTIDDNNYIVASIANDSLEEIGKRYPFKKQEYYVKHGDILVNLLRDICGLPRNLIFNEYLTIFRKLNPHVKDIHFLKVGMKIVLPIYSEMDLKRKLSNTTIDRQKELLRDIDITLLILKKLGFEIYKDSDLVFPLENGEWIFLNGKKTPIVVSPNGSKIVIVQEKEFNQLYKNNSKLRIYFCKVADLSPYNVLKKIELIEKDIKVWEKGSNLIIDKEHFVLEVNADLIVIKKIHNMTKKYYLFYMRPKKESYNERLIKYNLRNYNIYLYDFSRDKKEFFITDDINDKIYIPSIPNNLKTIITSASFKKELKNINLTFEDNCHLYVRVDKFTTANREIYLVDKNRSSLVPLLRAYGYEAFTY